jgi:hypothetical protein
MVGDSIIMGKTTITQFTVLGSEGTQFELEVDSSIGVFYVYYFDYEITEDIINFWDENGEVVFHMQNEKFITAFQQRIIAGEK